MCALYSYSKIRLFKYIDLLPQQADDVIHVETDGIYFPAHCLEAFQHNLFNRKPRLASLSHSATSGEISRSRA